ncbi:MAG: Gfo/Idh/MocA family oxidoreductase, partial [Planctomycetota bacterium]
MRERLNVGFLGVGNLVSKQHLPNAAKCPWLRVHTLCDLNADALDKHASRYRPERAGRDYHTMLADPAVDLVVIALSPDQHAPLTIESLRAGKHVYVEKPLSEDIPASLEVARVCRETRKHLAVGFNRRFAPSYVDAFEIVTRDVGPLLITYRMVDDFRDRPAHWKGRSRLLDEACHAFDVMNWFARSTPKRVFASGVGRPDDHHVVVEYGNGVSASLCLSSFGAFHWPKERLEIVGDNHVVAVEDFVELQTAGVPGVSDKRYPGLEYEGFTRGYARLYAELGLPFYRAMRSNMADLLLGSGLIEKYPDREKWSLVAEHFPEHLRIPINYSC